jgi:NADH:ubiquinone oxidoreductase subunit 4 (subunit M)
LAPLVVITIALGIYPKPVFDVTTPAVAKLIVDSKAALAMDHAKKVATVQKETAQ